MSEELAVLTLGSDVDVFTARQLARNLSAVVGLERLDATRLATAISELARESAATGGRLSFGLGPGGALVVRLVAGRLDADSASVQSAQRLVDAVTHRTEGGKDVVEMVMRGTRALTALDRQQLHRLVATHTPTDPIEELRQQNDELLSALDTIREKNLSLETLNRELEETNKGVMALYNELSDELERTNQGVVALYAEIDEKNLQLTAASEAKSRFLRNIGHELRTPANAVLGLAGLLADPGASPLSAEQGEQVQFIRVSATELVSLVDELMDLSKAESGRLVPNLRDVAVGDLCRELEGPARALLRDGVALQVEPVADDLTMHTDPDLLRHVLRNLLSNAAKFTVEGTVTLEVCRVDDRVRMLVIDTGIGMSEEEQSLVFEEFFQARTPLHASTRGTGLGLAFARSVAQVLGGDVTVSSREGVGTTFSVDLPLHLAPAGATS